MGVVLTSDGGGGWVVLDGVGWKIQRMTIEKRDVRELALRRVKR